jgi:integrase
MTNSSYGAQSRRPVYSGNRRVPGLYERTLADGSIVFEAALRLDGRVTRRRLVAATKTDAMLELAALRVDTGRGEAHRSPSLTPTLRELAVDYLRDLEVRVGDRDAKRRRSARSVAEARFKLERYILPVLGHVDVAQLRPGDVVRLLDHLARFTRWSPNAPHCKPKADKPAKVGLAPSTRTGALNVLSAVLRFGVKRGVLERNVVRDVDRDDRPGTRRLSEPRYLDRDELEALLASLGDTFRPIAATYTYAGLRLSEALGLRWRDLDLNAGTLTVENQLGPDGALLPLKTAASASVVRLVPALGRELRAHRKRQAANDLRRVHHDAFVFATATGRPQSGRNVLRAIHAAADAVGLNSNGRERVGVHDLRHSFVAQAFEHGLTLPEVSALARHATAQVTAQVYAGLTDKARERAAEKLAAAGFGA